MFTIDAHLDLSMNALEWNRDLTRPVAEINAREKGLRDKPDRGNATVSLPELRKGNVGLVVATQIARFVSPENPLPGWHSPEQAWAQTQGQLAWYRAMVEKGEMTQIRNWTELEAHLAHWNQGEDKSQMPVGFILSLEGADSIVNLSYLEKAYESGLRALGPAHYGPGRYAFGTDSSARLSQPGKELVKKMDELGIILDATHLCDLAFWDALEIYQGPVWASHNNCRALVDQAAALGFKDAQRLQASGYDLEEVTPDADNWKYAAIQLMNGKRDLTQIALQLAPDPWDQPQISGLAGHPAKPGKDAQDPQGPLRPKHRIGRIKPRIRPHVVLEPADHRGLGFRRHIAAGILQQ